MTPYRIDVKGRIPAGSAEEFIGMAVTTTDGLTTLRGEVSDSAALYGLITRLESLGVVLVQIQPDAPHDATPKASPMNTDTGTIHLDGWDIGRSDSIEWQPWGGDGNARAKVIAVADGFHVILVEARPGYRGGPHEHAQPEFLYVVDGTLRTQGRMMTAGDAYAAAAGSVHEDFITDRGATYLTVFKV